MFHIAKRQEMIFFLILGGLSKKKAPVSHRCLFMEIFLFSGIQSTSESFIETFAVPPFAAKPLSLPLHGDYKGSGIFLYTLINKKVRIPKRTEGKGSIRSSFLE